MRLSTSMENQQILLTSDALKYLEKAGMGYFDYNENMTINSGSGSVYNMPDGKVLLMPSNLKSDYPSILYTTYQDFFAAKENDTFSIPVDSMEWLERHRDAMHFLLKQKSVKKVWPEELECIEMYSSENDYYEAFLKAKELIRSKRSSNYDIENIIHNYSLSLIRYLNTTENLGISFIKKYALYNYYWYPLIQNKKGQSEDIMSITILYLKSNSKSAFKDYWNVFH